MLVPTSPSEAYRRVDFDARIEGADQAELVGVCTEQLVGSLGTAIFAQRGSDNALKSRSLTRALAAVTALRMGVAGEGGVAEALRHVYEAARRTILDSVLNFDAERLTAVRDDSREIGHAMREA